MKKKMYKGTLGACYIGYITQAIVVNFMPVLFVIFQEQFKLSYAQLGSLVLLNFITQMIVDVIAARYVDRIGYRWAAVPAHLFSAAGLICMAFLPSVLPNPYTGLMISVIVLAFGGGLIEVVISPVVDALPAEDSAASMSLLHSFYCWGQLGVVLITTLTLRYFNFFGSDLWKILAVCWTIVPIINTVNFLKVPLPKTIAEERHPMRQLLSTKGFLAALLLMTCAGAAEQTMAQWASLFAQKGLQISKVKGDLLGPCLFALFMALGRMWYGVKKVKPDLKRTLTLCSLLCVACYLVSVFSMNAFVSLAACALTGFTVSLMWPGVLSYTSNCFPRGGVAMFGAMAIFGDIGCSIGPWLAGVVSNTTQNMPAVVALGQKYGSNLEQTGLKAGILVGVIFPLIMIFGLGRLHKTEELCHPETE